MSPLDQLFGTPARSRLLKIFLMSPDVNFSVADIEEHTRLKPRQFLGELKRLEKIRLVRSGKLRRAVAAGESKRLGAKLKFVPTRVFAANKDYPLFPELRSLMIKSAPHAKSDLANRMRRIGAIKLAILAGVFISSSDSRVDLLIVGDGLKKSKLKVFVQWLEGQVGREMNYVAMSSQEFKYRMDMYDRFIRDILELPHETIINKLGV